MTRSQKMLLGILTISPLIGIGLYFMVFMFMFFGSLSGSPEMMFANMGILMGILIISSLLSLGLTIYYIIHAMNNKRLNHANNEQLIWVLLILFLNGIGTIVYWYMKIWKDADPDYNEILDA